MTPPILSYHKIEPRLELGFTRVGPRLFRRQMESLAAAGWRTVGSAALEAECGGAPARSLVLCFDDGYAGLDAHAFPVLAGLGMTALVFVITDFVGRDNAWDVQYGGLRFAHLDWDRLAHWQERGVIEVHSHTATHPRLTWLRDDEVTEELTRSREAIRARLGRAPAGVCYPFGAADARVARLAERAGYGVGFGGPLASGSDPWCLQRLMVYAWDAFAPPQVLRAGPLGALARWGARTTNRIAVGTAALQKLRGRRYAGR